MVCGTMIWCGVFGVIVTTASSEPRTTGGIFRDQVLPFLGGKIPESAFQPERLYTNRLNKNGVFSLDGVYYQERHPERHHFPRAFQPNTIKLEIPSDNRHVAQPGKNFKPHIVDTTYLIRDVVQDSIEPETLDFKDLPIIPLHSLQLSYKAKLKKRIFNNESVQIFQKYLPLLKKMHELYKRR